MLGSAASHNRPSPASPDLSVMASSTGTPNSSAKRRRQGSSALAKGVDILLEGSSSKDRAYILACLDSRPQLLPFIASMLRDGDIDRALQRRNQQQIAAVLGNKLGAKVKKHRHLSPKFVDKAIETLAGRKVFDDAADGKARNAPTASKKLEVLMFALHTLPDTALPTGHKHDRYEGALLKVMASRHTAMGERIKGLSWEKFDDIGFWGWAPSTPTIVQCKLDPSLKLRLPFAADFMKALKGVHIKANYDLASAALTATADGFSQALAPLLATQNPQHKWASTSADYADKHAADEFADVAMPEPPASPGVGGHAPSESSGAAGTADIEALVNAAGDLPTHAHSAESAEGES